LVDKEVSGQPGKMVRWQDGKIVRWRGDEVLGRCQGDGKGGEVPR